MIYMQRAYFAVETNDPDGPAGQAVAANHHTCRFGKWYDNGDGQTQYSHLPVYTNIVEPHSIVHNKVHAVMDVIRQDWQESKELQGQLLQSFLEAEQASASLTLLVDQLADEKKRFESVSTDTVGDIDLF